MEYNLIELQIHIMCLLDYFVRIRRLLFNLKVCIPILCRRFGFYSLKEYSVTDGKKHAKNV